MHRNCGAGDRGPGSAAGACRRQQPMEQSHAAKWPPPPVQANHAALTIALPLLASHTNAPATNARQPAIHTPRMSSSLATGWRLYSKWAKVPASVLREGYLVRKLRLLVFSFSDCRGCGRACRSAWCVGRNEPARRAFDGGYPCAVTSPLPAAFEDRTVLPYLPAGPAHGAAAQSEPAVCQGRQGGAVSLRSGAGCSACARRTAAASSP